MASTCHLTKQKAKSAAKKSRKAGHKAHMKHTKSKGWCVVRGKKRKSRKSKR